MSTLATLILLGAIYMVYDNHVIDIPVTVVVDKNITEKNPDWENNTKSVVEFETRLITKQKVRFVVKDYKIIDFPSDKNMTEMERLGIFNSNIDHSLSLAENEMIVVFTPNMPTNLYWAHLISTSRINGVNMVYSFEEYPDWLDFTKPAPLPPHRTIGDGPDSETYKYTVRDHMELLAPYVK